MKKKGFTLIELLAVIVILAIIALIATPLVLKYIEYSKEKSAKLSAQTYAEAVEKEYVSKLTSNEKMPNKEYTIKELDELGVKVKGDKPEGDSDTVTLQNGNVIEYVLTIKGYIITYENGNTTIESEKNVTTNSDGLLDYTVKFMVDGELYQFISVKDGFSITEPSINPTNDSGKFSGWTLNNEYISFPYFPKGDIVLSAKFLNVEDSLYNAFGISKAEYPFATFSLGSNNVLSFSFSDEMGISEYGNSIAIGGNKVGYSINTGVYSGYPTDREDVSAIVDYIINNIDKFTTSTINYIGAGSTEIYTNSSADFNLPSHTIYRF